MTVTFDSFEMREEFECSKERLFRAFTNEETKRLWLAEGAHSQTHDTIQYTLDASIGGKEFFQFRLNEKTPMPGLVVIIEGEHIARIENELLIMQSRMIANGSILSISNETFEFSEEGKNCAIKLTQQGTYLEFSDGPILRRQGHSNLFKFLRDFIEQ